MISPPPHLPCSNIVDAEMWVDPAKRDVITYLSPDWSTPLYSPRHDPCMFIDGVSYVENASEGLVCSHAILFPHIAPPHLFLC